MSLNMNEEEQGSNTVAVERQEISQMVKCRMASLGLPLEDYGEISAKIDFVVSSPRHRAIYQSCIFNQGEYREDILDKFQHWVQYIQLPLMSLFLQHDSRTEKEHIVVKNGFASNCM